VAYSTCKRSTKQTGVGVFFVPVALTVSLINARTRDLTVCRLVGLGLSVRQQVRN